MLVTEYQGPLISVFLSLLDREPASDLEGPAPQCSGPVRAALRLDSPPISRAVNVFAGLFADDAAFEEMPTVLAQRLDEAQREVLRGISHSTKALRVVDALAGTGKSHPARCLINRWGSMRDAGQGFLVMALRARTLRQEFLEALLADKVAVFEVCCSLVALIFGALSSLSFCPQSLSQLSGAMFALPCLASSSAISLGLRRSPF